MKFNFFARKEKPLTGYALGRQGTPAAVFEFARTSDGWEYKHETLEGAMDAYLAGETENLRQFLTGYLDLKRANGSISKMFNSTIDDGFLNLFADPMMRLMERSLDPAKTFEDITGQWSAFYRQIALDFILRRAAAANSDIVADCAIKLGADINAHNGRPLSVAISNRADRTSRLLISLKALTETEATANWKSADYDYYSRMRSQLAKTPTEPAPREDLIPTIAHKKRLAGKDAAP